MINPKLHLQLLRNKNGEYQDAPILMLFNVNGKRLQYYANVLVPVKYNPKLDSHGNLLTENSGKPIKIEGKYPFKKDMPDAAAIKIKLNSLIGHAYSIENELIKSGLPQSVNVFKEELDKRYKGKEVEVEKALSIEEVITEYLTHIKNSKAHNTFRNTQTSLNHFRSFLKSKANTLTVSNIDEAMVDSFQENLRDGRLNNTLVKALRILKTFLHYCVKKKHIAKLPLIETGSPNDVTVIHLNYDEVMNMAYTPMPSPTLERVRDFFVFGCFTGMRHSDISNIKKNNVFNDHVKIFLKKSGATQAMSVPLTEVSKSILEKYRPTRSDFAVPSISNQKTNDYLKDVARIVGMSSIVTIAEKDAYGKVKEIEHPKSDLITCHVSRKSFITIALTLGMPEAVIKSISGHSKNSKAFAKYYHVVDELKHQEMAKIFNR